ncbi:MAG: ATP-binding cassette domain-containing protein, partial [Clostridia bacterium]|nr:ATP-binding cassette domain-containing protein [Clostridia bacterium]
FYEMNGGDILIDGTSIKDLKKENVRDLFDMILQDTWLLRGTLRENLAYNTQNVTDEKLDTVCASVGLTHFVKTLPNGYDTYLGDTSNLSEGQKQQITIARAMLKDSPLLILDEATSNVDTRTELVIQKAMDELTEDRTSFVITHRLSTIKNADIILVMKNGDIIEQGNHETLLSEDGFYAELYKSQFEKV